MHKMKIKNNILFLVLIISLIGIASAETSWGTYKQNDCIDLSIVSDASFCVISSLKNPSSINTILNVTMNGVNGEFNYTTCNTSQLGIYTAKGNCDLTPWSNDFEITSSGKQLTISSAVIYVIVLIFTLILFLLCLYGSIVIKSENPRDEEGKVISINDSKHLKPLLALFAYIFAIWIFFNLWQISISFLFIDMASQIFYFLFVTSLICFFPIIIITALTFLVRGIQDKKLRRDLERGLNPR